MGRTPCHVTPHLPSSFSASVVSCSMLSPRFVVEENCQLSTSATWSQVPMGGLVKKFTFCTKEHTALSRDMGQEQGQVLPQPRSLASASLSHRDTAILTPALLPSHTSPTLGLLVSMLYHRMDAQALGI